ncbi:non-ribosomal peptide synthetase, partial [Mycobacterium ahvazicum]
VVRAPAGSENIRAEVAEWVGVAVDAVQQAGNLRCRALGSLRVTSPAGRSRRVAAGSRAAATHSAGALSHSAQASGEHHDIP